MPRGYVKMQYNNYKTSGIGFKNNQSFNVEWLKSTPGVKDTTTINGLSITPTGVQTH